MKKFLFTLVALLMAGSVCAEDYLYVEDLTLTQEQAAAGVENQAIFVKAHFESYVTTVDWTITLPEGVEFVSASMPNAAKPYIWQYVDVEDDDTGEIVSTLTRQRMNPQLFGEYPHFITTTSLGAASDNCYSEDGSICYGAPKWGVDPVEFNFYRIVVKIPAGYTGGDILVHSEPAGTDDPRGNVTVGGEFDKIGKIIVEQPATQPAPVPTFEWNADSYTMEAVCADHTVVLMIDGQPVANPYTVEQTYEEQVITFTAYTVANADESENSATVTSDPVTVPAKAKTPSNKPSVVVTPGDDAYTIEATGTGTVVLYVNGEEVTNPYVINRPAYGEADITVTAKASNLDSDPDGEIQYEIAWSAEQEVIVPAKDPEYYQTPDPVITITDDADAQTVTITVTGEGTVTMKVTKTADDPTMEGEVVYTTSGASPLTYTIPYGETEAYYSVYATATAAGDFVYPGDATEPLVVVPAYVPPTPVETMTFVKVTSADQLVAGKKYIIVCGDVAMGAEATGNFLTAIAITGGNEVEVGNDVAIMTLGGSLGHYTLALGDNYLTAANTTSLGFGSTATEWAIADYNGTLDGYRVKHADYNRAVRYNGTRFGNYSTSDQNSEYAWIYVEKSDEPVLQDLTGEIVFSEVNQEDGSFTVTYEGPEEDVTVEVTSMVEKTRAGYNLPDYGTYTVTAKATKDGYKDLEDSADLTWKAPVQTEKPVITVTESEDGYVVTATGDGTVILYVNDEKVAEGNGSATYTIPYTNTPEGDLWAVSATAQAEGELVSDYALKDVEDPGQTAKPNITTEDTGSAIVITATGDGEVILYNDDVEVARGNGSASYTVPYTQDEYGEEMGFSATAQDEGQRVSEPAVATVEIPGTPAPVVLPVMPTIDTQTTDAAVIVTATTTDGSTVVLYQCDENGENAQVIDNPSSFLRESAERTVYVYAVATNNDGSTTTEVTPVVVPAKPVEPDPTAINEMNAGKTIAAVRYFNMAGQEMQEANGMTIVVTTYTDGTSSAVKVMK